MASGAVAPLVIVHGREFEDPGFESGFFGDFAHHAFAGGLIDIRPSTGEGPVAVADLAHHEHAPIDEGGAPHIDLGRRVPVIRAQDAEDHVVVGT